MIGGESKQFLFCVPAQMLNAGGDSISVTQGVVSRVVLRRYSHSSTELLKIQIDAAINSGNSGGPVIMGNKVVGVAFESRCCSELIG